MKSKIVFILTFVSILLCSCDKKNANNPNDNLPAVKDTVFVAKIADGESCYSAVEENKTNDHIPRFMARHVFGNSRIEVGWEYIGKGSKGSNSKADVYLISFRIGDKPVQYEAVFYEGGNKVIIDRPEVVISFTQIRNLREL